MDSTHMIVASDGLTELFDSVGHYAVVGVCKPNGRRVRVRFLWTKKNKMKNIVVGARTDVKEALLTVMFPTISNWRPVGPTNLHITSSTVATCIWNRSWSLGNVDSSILICCFNAFRQAIVSGVAGGSLSLFAGPPTIAADEVVNAVLCDFRRTGWSRVSISPCESGGAGIPSASRWHRFLCYYYY